jgi:hypothetical protein
MLARQGARMQLEVRFSQCRWSFKFELGNNHDDDAFHAIDTLRVGHRHSPLPVAQWHASLFPVTRAKVDRGDTSEAAELPCGSRDLRVRPPAKVMT